MKPNEAPKKLYFGLQGDTGILDIYSKRESENDVEYVRKNAFIEKACDFFEENIEEEDCKIGSSEWIELRSHYESLDSFIRAFKNYMKGE